MDILVSGSMAYDRIMRFDGRFSDHILSDQLDNINISLALDSLTEHIGGTAGNIAYSLSLLGEKPRIVASLGRDYHRYFEWLDTWGIGTGDIRVVEDELTAGAYITTDVDSNQFTAFNPGSDEIPGRFQLRGRRPGQHDGHRWAGQHRGHGGVHRPEPRAGHLHHIRPRPIAARLGAVAPGPLHRAVQHTHLQRVRAGPGLQQHRAFAAGFGGDGGAPGGDPSATRAPT